ncbi:DsbA family protein [Spirosoma sp. BT702]|uniref:DsbA family protein n=1 Tax=Spirosoma profusum TaxID=2771354 RepID=A0A927AMT7_9BACT|nr:ClpXP adapter SpxH family protein [Spirosoma profusum]MBD2700469.1 DsbA family protein [Spirosoma profusum]
MENQNINPLLCDLETGQCQIPDFSTFDENNKPNKLVKVIYYTDPICSTCWGIEPQLRKLKLEYGNDLEIEYRMGGLLPDWSYNSGGISKPSDVAHHWDEVSQYYDMPIDGDIWLEDPLPSSYPPSIAFKAAQLQDHAKAVKFLRRIREMVFLQKKNITKWAHLAEAAQAVGLDSTQLRVDYDGKARTLFKEDLELGRQLGVRGFPTLFFKDNLGRQEIVYGFKPYDLYEKAVQNLHPLATKEVIDTKWQSLFSTYPSLTAREFAELSGISRQDSEAYLQKLTIQGHLNQLDTKNGSLWSNKN